MDLLGKDMDVLLNYGGQIRGMYVGGDQKDIAKYEKAEGGFCKDSSIPETNRKDRRHEIRKELKLLKMSNMKMKKQLRLSMRVRFLNGVRLEDEIVQLNKLLARLKSAVIDKNNAPNEMSNDEKFANPEKTKFQSGSSSLIDNNSIGSSIYIPPVKKEKGAYRFFCDSCEFRCVKRTPFEIHLRRHANDRPHACQHCQRRFVTSNDLKMHSARHATQKEFSCDQCQYTTYRADMLVNHKEKHTGLKTYECDICGFKTDERSRMINHRKSHDTVIIDTKPCLACGILKKSLRSDTENLSLKSTAVGKTDDEDKISPMNGDADRKNSLVLGDINGDTLLGRPRLSGLRHTCCNPWTCHFCGRSFKKRESLTKHLRTHTGERPHSCDQCDYSAATRYTLLVHKRTHSGDKPYICSQCDFRCTTKGYLKIHLNKHQGIKPYACKECDYRSVDSCKLSAHKKVKHSDLKPFSCDRCPFTTKLAARLRQHKKRHEARLLVCRHCGQGFRLHDTLLEHEGSHTGEQPFKCTQCSVEKRFTLETSYKRHLARHKQRFECQHCPYKAVFRKNLLKHSRSHAGGGGKCVICRKRCLNDDTMLRHMEIKHPNYSLTPVNPTNLTIDTANPISRVDSADITNTKKSGSEIVSNDANTTISINPTILISNTVAEHHANPNSSIITIPSTVFSNSIPMTQNLTTSMNLVNNTTISISNRNFTNTTNSTNPTDSTNVTNPTNPANTNLLQLLLSANPAQPSYQLNPTILNIPQSVPQRFYQFTETAGVDGALNSQENVGNVQLMMALPNPTPTMFYWGQG